MITLLNGEQWSREDILQRMDDDSFYYGYLGEHALSSSSLKKLVEGPKQYKKSLIRDDKPIQAFRDGRLIHLCLLEPEKVGDLIIMEGTKARNDFKEATAEHGEHMVYTKSELDNAYWIADAVKRNRHAEYLLSDMDRELSGIEMIEGLATRAKADAISKDKSVVIDLKTTSSPVDENSFRWSARNFKYNLQAALYLKVFGASEFTFLVINKETKDIGIFQCSEEFIASGEFLIEQGIETYNKYFASEEAKQEIQHHVVRGLL